MKTYVVGALAIALAFGLAACGGGDDGPTGPGGDEEANLTVAFAAPGVSPNPEAVVPPADGLSGEAGASVIRLRPAIELGGSNGTLVIDDLVIVVSGFAMETPDGNCAGAVGCARFPLVVLATPVPLTDGSISLVEGAIGAGNYDELKFEVEDLSVDQAGDDEKSAQLEGLLESVREDVPDWPADAALYVTGEFTPTGGDPVPFRTFLEAESQVALSFGAPLSISEEDSGDLIVVETSPSGWFAGNQVVDLSQYDYDTTQEVASFADFGATVSGGFTRVTQEGGGPAVSVIER